MTQKSIVICIALFFSLILAPISQAAPPLEDQLLFEAISYGKAERAQELIEDGANIDAIDKDGETVLHLAVKTQNKKLIKYLIQNKANINAVNKYKETPLHVAAQWAGVEIAKILIHAQANINAVDGFESISWTQKC